MSAGSPRTVRPRLLIAISFATLSAGFAAGYWLAGTGEPVGRGVPHAVGTEEFHRLGMQALAAGDPVEAERRFRQAIASRPEDPGPRVDLAVALMSQGRHDEAEAELSETKRLAPDMPAVWFLEGLLARDVRGDTARARMAWTTFLELVPPDSPQAAQVREWLAASGAGTNSPPNTGEGP